MLKPIKVSPPPARDWSFIVLKVAGTGLEAEIQDELDTVDRAGTSPHAWITLRAEQDGRITDYAAGDASAGRHRLAPAVGGMRGADARATPMLSGDTIRDFLLNAMDQYPAKHYMVAVDGHSHLIRQAIRPIRDALRAAMRAHRGRKIDVLAFDSCFMAQLETASEFHDVARVLVASEEAVGGARPVEKLARMAAQGPLSGRALAAWLVRHSDEYTLSALDLDRVETVNRRTRALGEELIKVTDGADLERLRGLIHSAQHFFCEGMAAPHPLRSTVDVVDVAARIGRDAKLARRYPALAAAARDVADALHVRPHGLVFAEKHTRRIDKTPELDYVDVRHAHGISVYLPTAPDFLRSEYTHFHDSEFDRETRFESVIAHLTADRSRPYLEACLKDFVTGLKLATRGEELEAEADAREAASVRACVRHRKDLP